MICYHSYLRYCKGDFVLAGVGRLHEVLGGAHLGGMAGLTPVPEDVCNKYGIENVDISDIIEGVYFMLVYIS